MSGVRTAVVDAGGDGQRIDNFLLRELRGVPRSHVYRLLRSGQVRVNGGRVKPTRRLAIGDTVRIPPVQVAAASEPVITAQATARLDGRIVFEDRNFLVIDKPAGTAVHGGSGISAGVIELLRASRNEPQLELAHRLDRDTSGLLLMARRRSALRRAHAAFAAHEVKKVYLAVVRGRWSKRRTVVRAALLRVQRGDERRVRVDAAGKAAETYVQVVAQWPSASLLEVTPTTGRTHQIRVHLASAGHVIIGDTKYGPDAPGDDPISAGRLMLHAARLTCPGLEIDCSAPPPGGFDAVCARLRGPAPT